MSAFDRRARGTTAVRVAPEVCEGCDLHGREEMAPSGVIYSCEFMIVRMSRELYEGQTVPRGCVRLDRQNVFWKLREL